MAKAFWFFAFAAFWIILILILGKIAINLITYRATPPLKAWSKWSKWSHRPRKWWPW